jgi:uncharacterized membrane protein YebE (DUF533 family)
MKCVKGAAFDSLRQPTYVEKLAHNLCVMEQRYEIISVFCLVINLDDPSEHNYLNKLASTLILPSNLAGWIKSEVKQTLNNE